MKRHLILAAVIAAVVMAFGDRATSASERHGDQSKHAKATLNGFEENPSISTTGTGTLDLRIDDEAQRIDFELSYGDLEGVGTTPFVVNGVVTASHVHVGARGVNGGVSAFFCGGGGKPPCPVSGTVSGEIGPNDVVGPAGQGINPGEPTAFAELVEAIRAGYAYVNVHSTRWPGGEIRGQIK